MLALQKDSRHILLLALIRGQLQQELLLFPLCALAVVGGLTHHLHIQAAQVALWLTKIIYQ
jgi:hypothetical protein